MELTQIPKWTLGDKLRKARQAGGIRSHKEMAKRLGVSEDTVKRWEADKYAPTRGYVLGWAAVCGVDPDWLIGVEGGDTATEPVTLQESSDWRQFSASPIETVAAA